MREEEWKSRIEGVKEDGYVVRKKREDKVGDNITEDD